MLHTFEWSTYPNCVQELSISPTFMTNMQPMSVMKRSFVDPSIASLATLDPLFKSDAKHETGILRKTSPVSASKQKRICCILSHLVYYVPIMLTMTKPWYLIEVMITGSSEYGSITVKPSKSPERRSLGDDGEKNCMSRWDNVNNPSSVTE